MRQALWGFTESPLCSTTRHCLKRSAGLLQVFKACRFSIWWTSGEGVCSLLSVLRGAAGGVCVCVCVCARHVCWRVGGAVLLMPLPDQPETHCWAWFGVNHDAYTDLRVCNPSAAVLWVCMQQLFKRLSGRLRHVGAVSRQPKGRFLKRDEGLAASLA